MTVKKKGEQRDVQRGKQKEEQKKNGR